MKINKTYNDKPSVTVSGHVTAHDDLGNLLLDDHNDIHPRNFARIFARALAGEQNSSVYRMAFGNGGTTTDALYTITYKTPNTGEDPDTTRWASRLYNEIYSKTISDISSMVNSSNPLESKVVITVTLENDEPRSQSQTDNLPPSQIPSEPVVIDEIGLYTSGAPNLATNGTLQINFNTPTLTEDDVIVGVTSLANSFDVNVDSETPSFITVTATIVGPVTITYGNLIDELNNQFTNNELPITASFENGSIILTNNTYGSTSIIEIDNDELFNVLPAYIETLDPVPGEDAGVEDNSSDQSLERERLLTHIIFSPILKSSNRTIIINYTLTISVE